MSPHGHGGRVELKHSFEEAYAYVKACGPLDLPGEESEDPAACWPGARVFAAVDARGRPCLEFSDEEGKPRIYDCCWGRNGSMDRFKPVGLWSRQIDERVRRRIPRSAWFLSRLPEILGWAGVLLFLVLLARCGTAPLR